MLMVGVIAAALVCSRCAASPAPPLEELTVRPGEDAPLGCRGPRDAEITLIQWSRPELKAGGYVFFYRNRRSYEKYQHEAFKGRVALRDPSVKDGDVSVILRNVSISDTGTYECLVRTKTIRGGEKDPPGEVKHSINLTVAASGVVEKVTKNDGDGSGLLSVAAGVPVAVFFLFLAVGLVVFRKVKRNLTNRLKERLNPSPI